MKRLLIALSLLILLSSCGTESANETSPDTNLSNESETESVDSETAENDNESINLVAGQLGDYGTYMTLNKGTEFENTYIAYHVPEGTYTVTNNGEYMSQISVYGDETHITEEGWEEPATSIDVKLIALGESETITIGNEQYIKIVEPSNFILDLQ